MYRSTTLASWKDLPLFSQPIAIVLANLAYVSASTIQATLYVFICASILLLQELKERLSHSKIKCSSQMLLELEQWRRHHDLVLSLIEKINNCFCPCLLITLIYSNSIFVRFTCNAINNYQWGAKESIVFTFFLPVVVVFLRLISIIYPSHMMKIEVSIIDRIRKILSC